MQSPRVVVIHGWDGSPTEGWFPWLKSALEKQDIRVDAPLMPDASFPRIEAWDSHLSEIIGALDEHTFLVGHSIGCQTIMRYLEKLPFLSKVGGLIFVAGWFTLMNLQTDEEREIARPWLETPIDGQKVTSHTDRILAVFSDNDDVVPLENQHLFETRLGARTILEHHKGHFSGGEGITEIPIVLETLISWISA